MGDSIKVVIENSAITCEIPSGCTLQEIAEILNIESKYPFLAAYVNNRIRELQYRIYSSATIRYVDHTFFAGVRTYQRTMFIILQKAIEELYPN